MPSTASQPDYSSFRFQAILFAGLALLLFHGFYYYPFVIDDTFISLRYAGRLISGHGLTWNDGEYVEGYSDLLWVLLNALLGSLSFDLEGSARFLCLVSTLLVPLALVYHAREAKLPVFSFIAAFGCFIAMPPVGIWSIAGMEAPMVMLCLAWAAVLSYKLMAKADMKNASIIGVMLALICLLRPEGPLYTIAIAASLFVFSNLSMRERLRLCFVICAIPCAAFLGQLGFRLYMYGQWVPNTVLVKVSFTVDRYKHGFIYVAKAWVSFMPLLFYCWFNTNSARKNAAKEGANLKYMYFLISLFVILSGAILSAGGDIFFGFRAFVPLAPILALGVMHCLTVGMKYTEVKKEMIFFFYIFICHVAVQFSIDTNQQPKHRAWVQRAILIGSALKEKYGDKQPLIATHAAGAIPFYSELPTLDVYGLNDSGIVKMRHSDKNFGHGLIGHELFDADYVNSRKPDLLLFDIPGMEPLCEGFPEECKKLLPHYREETMRIPGYDIKLYIRKDSKILN